VPGEPDAPVVTGTRVAPAGVRVAGADGDDEGSRRRAALDQVLGLMAPAVAEDGGELVLVAADVETGVVRVRLQGACGSCAISATTLQGGVERILRERLPWVTEVVGEVDDSLDFGESSARGRGAYVPRRS
jgi:Fe-S cluster biogenesis protein NfuA